MLESNKEFYIRLEGSDKVSYAVKIKGYHFTVRDREPYTVVTHYGIYKVNSKKWLMYELTTGLLVCKGNRREDCIQQVINGGLHEKVRKVLTSDRGAKFQLALEELINTNSLLLTEFALRYPEVV